MKIEVHLWSGLRTLTDGLEKVEVEASNTGELLDALTEEYPALVPVIEAGVSIAIDGRIIATGLLEPLRSDQEIYLMQRLKGGEFLGPSPKPRDIFSQMKTGSNKKPDGNRRAFSIVGAAGSYSAGASVLAVPFTHSLRPCIKA